MSYSIEGRTAIVTGAAYGVGQAIARHFVEQGANVMFADIDEDALERDVGDEASREGPVRFFGGDLRERLTVANLLSATIDAFDRIDILVNGSRQCMPSDPLSVEDTSVEHLLQVNMMSSLRLSQAVARRMISQARESEDETRSNGAIVNLSSIAARLTQPELMGYSISTAAVEQMTRSFAVALAPHRIRVNAVSFGSVMTASLQGQIREHPEFRDSIRAHTPLGRIASAAEVAESVQYLVSESADFVTGQVLVMDGGRGLLDPVQVPAH